MAVRIVEFLLLHVYSTSTVVVLGGQHTSQRERGKEIETARIPLLPFRVKAKLNIKSSDSRVPLCCASSDTFFVAVLLASKLCFQYSAWPCYIRLLDLELR